MANYKKPAYKNNKGISYFSVENSLSSAEFEAGEDSTVIKKALVMVEGEHVDSAKKRHVFSPARIQKIVENTNNFLAQGGRVPWQRDHKKDQESNIGDLEGPLEIRVITESDLPNKKLRHLVGKVGAFTTQLVAKGQDVVNELIAGRIKTLSPGIDIAQDLIREISATPTPAIVGLSVFSRAAQQQVGDFGLTFDEVEAEGEEEDQMKEMFEDLSDKFWTIITNITQATDEELQGQDPTDFIYQAIGDYSARIEQLLGLGEDPMGMEGQGIPGSQQPGYLPQQQGYQQGYANMSRYYGGTAQPVLAAFSMAEMEALDGNMANFGRRVGSKDKTKRKSRLGMAAKVGAGVAGAGAVGAAGLTATGFMGKNSAPLRMRTKRNLGTLKQTVGELGQKGMRKQAVKDLGQNLGALGSNLKSGLKIGAGKAKYGAGQLASSAGSKLGSAAGAARKLAGTRGGKIGLGLAAAGAVGGGAYAAMRSRKKK